MVIAADADGAVAEAGAGLGGDAGDLELAKDDLGENSTPCSPLSLVGSGAGLGFLRKSPHK